MMAVKSYHALDLIGHAANKGFKQAGQDFGAMSFRIAI